MTEALVLRTSAYSESTLIVWLLTRDEGVARALAKGARRLKGGASAAFDLFTRVRVNMRLASPDRLGNISSVDLVHAWDYLRSDLKRFAFVSLGMEVLGAVAANSTPEPFFFDEAVDFLDAMETAAGPGSLTAALLLRALHHSGHPPRIDPDIEGGALPQRMGFDFGEGVFRGLGGAAGVDRVDKMDEMDRVDEMDEMDGMDGMDRVDLVGGASAGGGALYPVSRAMVERLRPALIAPPPLDGSFNLPGQEGRRALQWLARVWADHLNQPLKSFEFIEKSGWL